MTIVQEKSFDVFFTKNLWKNLSFWKFKMAEKFNMNNSIFQKILDLYSTSILNVKPTNQNGG
jgi:hypothetical protein